ncbi:variable large family protein [Borrelia crocidurae]|uniref:variable large family protein n=1 Tax=Borrelia crocidurae TaxID=29520 RepID=UPI000316C7EF|nr:variable large family protein [Borrelia crocidurae]
MLEVGRIAENAFYAFIELMSDTLGLKVTKDTKRSDVAGYFNSLGGKLLESIRRIRKSSKQDNIRC